MTNPDANPRHSHILHPGDSIDSTLKMGLIALDVVGIDLEMDLATNGAPRTVARFFD